MTLKNIIINKIIFIATVITLTACTGIGKLNTPMTDKAINRVAEIHAIDRKCPSLSVNPKRYQDAIYMYCISYKVEHPGKKVCTKKLFKGIRDFKAPNWTTKQACTYGRKKYGRNGYNMKNLLISSRR